MGQKVHPESLRVGYIHDWKSNWFNERNFSDYLAEDVQVRDHIVSKLAHAGQGEARGTRDGGAGGRRGRGRSRGAGDRGGEGRRRDAQARAAP